MRRRPRELELLALFLCLTALSFPIQIMFLFGHLPWELPQVLAKLTPLNWCVIDLALISAASLYRASPLSLPLAPVLILFVAWNNYTVASFGLNFPTTVTILSTIALAAGHSVLLRKRIRHLLTHPRQRWWLTPPRKQIARPATVRPTLGGELRTRSFDLSTGGAFFELDEAAWQGYSLEQDRQLRVGSNCAVWLKLDSFHVLKAQGRVVRQSVGDGHYPKGFAVQFVGLAGEDKRALTRYLRTGGQPQVEMAM